MLFSADLARYINVPLGEGDDVRVSGRDVSYISYRQMGTDHRKPPFDAPSTPLHGTFNLQTNFESADQRELSRRSEDETNRKPSRV